MNEPKKILLTNHQSFGDILTLSALPRDIHRQYPGEYEIGVSTGFREIWNGNPYVTFMNVGPNAEVDGWQKIQCRYPKINESNRLSIHFVTAWHDYLSRVIGRKIECTEMRGDIYMTDEEKEKYPVLDTAGEPVRYWVMLAGCKQDYTAKMIPKIHMQEVVYRIREAFHDKIKVVQIGAMGHIHPNLDGVINMIGETDVRQVLQLIYHCDGVVGPVSFLNHASAAVPLKRAKFNLPVTEHPGNPENLRVGQPLRPNVVIAGGREPVHWEQYPGSQFLHTIGTMDCCSFGGCWRSRCTQMLDGDVKDKLHVCLRPVEMGSFNYPECLVRIKPEQIFGAIYSYYKHGALTIPK